MGRKKGNDRDRSVRMSPEILIADMRGCDISGDLYFLFSIFIIHPYYLFRAHVNKMKLRIAKINKCMINIIKNI